MRRNIINICLVIIILIAIGCSPNQTTNGTKSLVGNSSKKQDLPWYVAKQPVNNALYIYGVGSGRSVIEANTSAIEAIVSYYKLYMEKEYQGYIESNQINDKEYFREYINDKKLLLSNLDIPGIAIAETSIVGTTYYTLAALDKEILTYSQSAIKKEIMDILRQATTQNNPGLKLQAYYHATSLLVKLIEPLYDQNRLVIGDISDSITSIFSDLKIKYRFASFSQYSEYRDLAIAINSQGKILTGIPLLIGNKVCYPNERGNYFLENSNNEPFDLVIKVAVAELKLTPELRGKQIQDAKDLIKLITPFEQNIHFIPPVNIKAYIEVSHFIDNEQSNNPQLLNQIKQLLLRRNIAITPIQQEANMHIIAITYANESSHNQHLGYAYKGEGEIRITGVNNETVVIDLSDEKTKESTKSFAKQKQQSANSATLKLNSLLIEQLEQIKLDN